MALTTAPSRAPAPTRPPRASGESRPNARAFFPGIRFGVVLGTRRLVELVGARGYRVILEQEMLNAEDALNTGLITDIIEAEAWLRWSKTLAPASALYPRMPQNW